MSNSNHSQIETPNPRSRWFVAVVLVIVVAILSTLLTPAVGESPIAAAADGEPASELSQPETDAPTAADIARTAASNQPATGGTVGADDFDVSLTAPDGSLEVENLGEVRDADLPVWVVMELVGHDRLVELAGDDPEITMDDIWAKMPAAEIDKPFEYPVTVNPEEARRAQDEFEQEYASEIAAAADELLSGVTDSEFEEAASANPLETPRAQDFEQGNAPELSAEDLRRSAAGEPKIGAWFVIPILAAIFVVKEVCTDRPWRAAETEEFNWEMNKSDVKNSSNTKRFANGIGQLTSTASIEGDLTIDGSVIFQRKENKCFDLPAGLRVLELNVNIDVDLDGSLATGGAVGVGYHNENLLKFDPITLGRMRNVKIPVYPGVDIELNAHLQLLLGAKLSAEAAVRAETKVGEEFIVTGNHRTEIRCERTASGTDKCRSSDHSNLDFDMATVEAQTTVDVTLTPWAEIRLDASADLVLVSDLISLGIIDGRFGAVFEFPTRLYWTYGNGCSDANGDGTNERVEVLAVDASMEVSAYWNVKLLEDSVSAWKSTLELTGDNKWQKKIGSKLDELTNINGDRHLFTTSLYFDTIHEGENTPFSPVIVQAGQFDRGQGIEEGVVIGGTRSCYPFNSPVEYEIDWSIHNDDVTRVTEAGFVAYDWSDSAINNDEIQVRIVGDEDGREFKADHGNATVAAVSGATNDAIADITVEVEVADDTTVDVADDITVEVANESDQPGRYELVIQDGEFRYVVDTVDNTRAWAGHCTDAALNATPRAVTWADISNIVETETPGCEELARRLATSGAPTQAAPQSNEQASTPAPSNTCDYTDADLNNGWGWDPVNNVSCEPVA